MTDCGGMGPCVLPQQILARANYRTGTQAVFRKVGKQAMAVARQHVTWEEFLRALLRSTFS